MGFLLRFWREIALVLLVLALAASGSYALHQAKAIGVRDEQIAGHVRAIKVRDGAIKILAQRATKTATFERGSYELCQAQASESTAQAFQRGITVGKTIERRTRCASQP